MAVAMMIKRRQENGSPQRGFTVADAIMQSPSPVAKKNRGHVLLEASLEKGRLGGKFGYHPRWFILTNRRLLYFKERPSDAVRASHHWSQREHNGTIGGCLGCNSWHVPSDEVCWARGEAKLANIVQVEIEVEDSGHTLLRVHFTNEAAWNLRTDPRTARQWKSALEVACANPNVSI
eukprot:CAMPEP_0114560880 /NCGR_PEP_ID=MMETSP0114-20121206/11702_1 /TAXON_ID=31324 /ORGANISM="Goniomonas sp, Strain m" /LENGTH=176 /DNA_ID=CAMNT_0001746469 /DNA_START=1 /DNA_END=531 /DNA_ORIENTATION=-